MIVLQVPLHQAHQYWPHVEHFFTVALESDFSSGEITASQLRSDLGQNRASLYVAKDEETVHGCAAISFQNMRNDRVAFIIAFGGKLVTEEENFKQLQSLLRQQGATKIQGACRDSMVRLASHLNFKKKYTIIEAAL